MAYRTRFFLTVLGQIVPLGVALVLVVLAPNNWYKAAVYVAAVILIFTAEYIRVCRPLANIDEMRRKQFAFFFERFADTARINGEPANLRVNIMLKKLTFRGWRFYQYYQYKMAGWPDSDIHFPIKCGLCGLAFKERSHDVVYRSKAELDAENYGFSSEELALLKHVRAIATIPLYREQKTLRGHMAYKYFGVLNVDAVDEAGENLLAEPQIQEQIRALAEFVRISS
jgi:hypothetical protein